MIKNLFVFLGIYLIANFKSPSQEYILKTIPQREKGVLDLTIKKISSKPITGVIDRIDKTIFLEVYEDNYIYLTEDLNELNYVSVTGKNNNYNKVINYNSDLLSGKEIRNGNLLYILQNFNGKKIVKLTYQIEPNDLYVGIVQRNGDLEKVYKIELIENVDKKFEYLGLTIETPEALDFRKTSFSKGRSSKIAASTQIVVTNPNGLELMLKTKTDKVDLKNDENNILTVENFNIEEKKESKKNIFTLTGNINNISPDTQPGQYKGVVYLELYSQ